MNQIDLEGRVAVVTGGAQGLGFAIARRLLMSGAKVSLWDMNADLLASAKAELGDGASTIVVNVTDYEAVASAAAKVDVSGVTHQICDRPSIASKVPGRVYVQPQWVFDSFGYAGRQHDSILLALPSSQLAITYLLDYPGKQLPTQAAHFCLGNNQEFAGQLAPARSYIMDFEYEQVVRLIGKSIEDCLVIGASNTNLQWDNEPARHKLLDLLGDMGTLGSPIKGHFIGIRTGHKVNIKMCHKLWGAC